MQNTTLNNYVMLLNRHFGHFVSVNTAYVETGMGGIPFIEPPGLDSLPEYQLLDRVFMHERFTSVHPNRAGATEELITKIKRFLRDSLTTSNPEDVTILWRKLPEIVHERDFETMEDEYRGYARMGILSDSNSD
jgi:hypothetical protein